MLGAGLAGGLMVAVPAPIHRPVRRTREELEILGRPTWAGDDRPPGVVADEPDVRVLVVHHTVNRNDYAEADVVGLLRDIHVFHTGPSKGWPDIAYNFIVDRFGRVWETRSGSIDRPVAGDATGGSQGFDQKCAFLGDHGTEPPSAAAATAMVGLLAFLADRSDVDTTPGATTAFVSRGSNRHPSGSTVTSATITGHRTLSSTACPGDAAFALVRDRFPGEVTARRVGAAPAPSQPASPTPSSTSPSSHATAPPSTTAPATTSSPAPSHANGPTPVPADQPPDWFVGGAAAGAGAVLLGGLLVLRSRRS